MFNLYIFMLGVIIGSFLNVLIYRLPNNKNWINDRSKCINCNHELRWFELIPLLSFIFLKGKCRYCKQSISLRYPLVELITGFSFLCIYVFKLNILSYVIVSLLITLVFTDFEYLSVPFSLLILLFILSGAYFFINKNTTAIVHIFLYIHLLIIFFVQDKIQEGKYLYSFLLIINILLFVIISYKFNITYLNNSVNDLIKVFLVIVILYVANKFIIKRNLIFELTSMLYMNYVFIGYKNYMYLIVTSIITVLLYFYLDKEILTLKVDEESLSYEEKEIEIEDNKFFKTIGDGDLYLLWPLILIIKPFMFIDFIMYMSVIPLILNFIVFKNKNKFIPFMPYIIYGFIISYIKFL